MLKNLSMQHISGNNLGVPHTWGLSKINHGMEEKCTDKPLVFNPNFLPPGCGPTLMACGSFGALRLAAARPFCLYLNFCLCCECCVVCVLMMMIAIITIESSLVPLIEGLCAQI